MRASLIALSAAASACAPHRPLKHGQRGAERVAAPSAELALPSNWAAERSPVASLGSDVYWLMNGSSGPTCVRWHLTPSRGDPRQGTMWHQRQVSCDWVARFGMEFRMGLDRIDIAAPQTDLLRGGAAVRVDRGQCEDSIVIDSIRESQITTSHGMWFRSGQACEAARLSGRAPRPMGETACRSEILRSINRRARPPRLPRSAMAQVRRILKRDTSWTPSAAGRSCERFSVSSSDGGLSGRIVQQSQDGGYRMVKAYRFRIDRRCSLLRVSGPSHRSVAAGGQHEGKIGALGGHAVDIRRVTSRFSPVDHRPWFASRSACEAAVARRKGVKRRNPLSRARRFRRHQRLARRADPQPASKTGSSSGAKSRP